MRVALIAAVILGLAGPASAQTTRCGWEFGKWVCRAEPQRQPLTPTPFQSGADSFARGYEMGERMRRDRQAAQQAASDNDLAAERRRLEAVQIVQGYIAAGRCEDARRVAQQYFGDRGEADARELCPN